MSPAPKAKRPYKKRVVPVATPEAMSDSVIYLRAACEDTFKQSAAGQITMRTLRKSHLLPLLALCELEGR